MLVQIILLLVLAYSLVLLFVISSAFFSYLRTRVPFVPTPVKDLEQLALLLQIDSDDVFLDIGSGNGRVVFEMEKFGFKEVRGIESGMWTHFLAIMNKTRKKSKAKFIRKNFFKESWSDVTVLYCYLYPHLMRSVGEKALADMKKGAKVVSRDFPIPNLKLLDRIHPNHHHEFFIYEI